MGTQMDGLMKKQAQERTCTMFVPQPERTRWTVRVELGLRESLQRQTRPQLKRRKRVNRFNFIRGFGLILFCANVQMIILETWAVYRLHVNSESCCKTFDGSRAAVIAAAAAAATRAARACARQVSVLCSCIMVCRV
jgi:hypothetical protein